MRFANADAPLPKPGLPTVVNMLYKNPSETLNIEMVGDWGRAGITLQSAYSGC